MKCGASSYFTWQASHASDLPSHRGHANNWIGQWEFQDPMFRGYTPNSYPIGSMYGIYANIWGILMGSMLPYIAAPWIRHGYGQKCGTIPYLHQLDPGDLPLKNGGSYPMGFQHGIQRIQPGPYPVRLWLLQFAMVWIDGPNRNRWWTTGFTVLKKAWWIFPWQTVNVITRW